jgi:hypothetical protein
MHFARVLAAALDNMILSHTDSSFLYRRQLLTATIGVLAAVSIVVPSDTWFERLLAPLKVILIGALAYGAAFIILKLFGSFIHWFAKFYALFCYYGGIVGLVLTPILIAADPEGAGLGPAGFAPSEYFSLVLPQMAAGAFAAAAGYNWLTANDAA